LAGVSARDPYPPLYWVLGVYFAAALALTTVIIALAYVLGEPPCAAADQCQADSCLLPPPDEARDADLIEDHRGLFRARPGLSLAFAA